MIDYSTFFSSLHETPLEPWLDILPGQINEALKNSHHSDLSKWADVLNQLPRINPSVVKLTSDCIKIGSAEDCSTETRQLLQQLLMQLHPWRKGPFCLFGIHIDTEWRSDWKWNRLKDHIQPLDGRCVLDVGCGSGYHCLRMAGAGAKRVIGLEPGMLSVMQFQTMRHFIQPGNIDVLPLSLEAMPDNLHAFDSIFSMGVLYHRRSPFDHLLKLRSALQHGGELVLETLVIDGKEGEILVPEDRYAKMRNVWFVPSCLTLESWIKRCNFKNIRLIDVTQTTTHEQRRTEWMRYESLTDFLDSDNLNRTIEGYPAPRRAIFIVESP